MTSHSYLYFYGCYHHHKVHKLLMAKAQPTSLVVSAGNTRIEKKISKWFAICLLSFWDFIDTNEEFGFDINVSVT